MNDLSYFQRHPEKLYRLRKLSKIERKRLIKRDIAAWREILAICEEQGGKPSLVVVRLEGQQLAHVPVVAVWEEDPFVVGPDGTQCSPEALAERLLERFTTLRPATP